MREALFRSLFDRQRRLAAAVAKGSGGHAAANLHKYVWAVSKDTARYGNVESAIPSTLDESDNSIAFIITTVNEDRDGDVVVPVGISLKNYSRNPVVFFGHQERPIPIGVARDPQGRLCVWPEEKLVRAKCFFDTADPDADFIFGKVKRGVLSATSIAFVPLEAERREFEEKAHRQTMNPPGWFFKRVDLTEWSVVGIPSNAEAVRDALDSEKSFISPRLQKALVPYAAKAGGRCFAGWCPGPRGVCVPCEKGTDDKKYLIQVKQPDGSWLTVASKDGYGAANMRLHSLTADGKEARIVESQNSKAVKAARGPQPEPRRWNKSLSKVFEVSQEELPASETMYDWAAKYLGCQIKEIYQASELIPHPRMPSFLVGLSKTLQGHHLLDTRKIGGKYEKGNESPPVYETLKLNSRSSGTFLIDGTQFWQFGRPGMAKQVRVVQKSSMPQAPKFIFQFEPDWKGLIVTTYAKTCQAGMVQAITNGAWLWAKANNLLKGEAFALSGEFLPRTDEGWDDVFLEEKNRKVLARVTKLFNEKQMGFANRGLMLFGPPGTGKTLSGRIMRNQCKGTFIWLSSRDFHKSGSFGGVSLAFEMARELAPAIIFMEDVDNWLHDTTIDLLKTEMDGISRSKGVLTVLTTNFPERMPEALIDRPGRFHDVLNFDLPAAEARKGMLRKWLPDVPDETVALAVSKTQGYSGAHVYELAQFARTLHEHDDVDAVEAVEQALRKIDDQKELINQILLQGSNYNRPGRRKSTLANDDFPSPEAYKSKSLSNGRPVSPAVAAEFRRLMGKLDKAVQPTTFLVPRDRGFAWVGPGVPQAVKDMVFPSTMEAINALRAAGQTSGYIVRPDIEDAKSPRRIKNNLRATSMKTKKPAKVKKGRFNVGDRVSWGGSAVGTIEDGPLESGEGTTYIIRTENGSKVHVLESRIQLAKAAAKKKTYRYDSAGKQVEIIDGSGGKWFANVWNGNVVESRLGPFASESEAISAADAVTGHPKKTAKKPCCPACGKGRPCRKHAKVSKIDSASATPQQLADNLKQQFSTLSQAISQAQTYMNSTSGEQSQKWAEALNILRNEGKSLSKDAESDCVSRKIEFMAGEGKDPKDPQTVAIAYSYCRDKEYKLVRSQPVATGTKEKGVNPTSVAELLRSNGVNCSVSGGEQLSVKTSAENLNEAEQILVHNGFVGVQREGTTRLLLPRNQPNKSKGKDGTALLLKHGDEFVRVVLSEVTKKVEYSQVRGEGWYVMENGKQLAGPFPSLEDAKRWVVEGGKSYHIVSEVKGTHPTVAKALEKMGFEKQNKVQVRADRLRTGDLNTSNGKTVDDAETMSGGVVRITYTDGSSERRAANEGVWVERKALNESSGTAGGYAVPEETKAPAYTLEQRADGWYIVYVHGREFGPYASRQMAQQAAIDLDKSKGEKPMKKKPAAKTRKAKDESELDREDQETKAEDEAAEEEKADPDDEEEKDGADDDSPSGLEEPPPVVEEAEPEPVPDEPVQAPHSAHALAQAHEHLASLKGWMAKEDPLFDNANVKAYLKDELSPAIDEHMEKIKALFDQEHPDHDMDELKGIAAPPPEEGEDETGEAAVVEESEPEEEPVEEPSDLEGKDETPMADDASEEILERYRQPKGRKKGYTAKASSCMKDASEYMTDLAEDAAIPKRHKSGLKYHAAALDAASKEVGPEDEGQETKIGDPNFIQSEPTVAMAEDEEAVEEKAGDEELERAYQEGVEARRRGDPHNPYIDKDPQLEFNWAQGYSQGKAADEDVVEEKTDDEDAEETKAEDEENEEKRKARPSNGKPVSTEVAAAFAALQRRMRLVGLN